MKSSLQKVRYTIILALQFNVIEMFSRVRIFDFFAYFVRQVQAIMIDAAPLGSMLAVVVLTQTLLFWILD